MYELMNIGGKHTNAVEDSMLIRKVRLDSDGDILKLEFVYHRDEPMKIIKISEREVTALFEGTLSIN